MANVSLNKKSVRICIMATVPISIVSFYGSQLDYLKANGFEVTVITSPDDFLAGKISSTCKLFLVPMSRRVSPFKDLISFFRLFKVIRKGRFDIIQYSSPKAALLGSICGYFSGIPVRLYLMWGIYYTGQTGWKRAFMKSVEKLVCGLSTAVSPDSGGNYNFALEEGLAPSSKLSVVGNGSANGVDLERFDPQRLKAKGANIRQSLAIPKDAVVAGFVGRLRRDKGINELVQAFLGLAVKYPDLYLLLVGPQENQKGEYESQVLIALSEEKRIVSVGFQQNPEDYLAAMDIFVLPSYREGFGIVNIEASAMGLPVISTDIPGPRDSVLNKKTGILIPAKSVDTLSLAMETLLNNLLLRQNMGSVGRQWAKNFEQKSLWEQIVSHRLSLLEKAPGARSMGSKRIFDLILATLLVFLTMPLIFLTAWVIFLTLGWPILFCQLRPGYKGDLFTIYKFRTMRKVLSDEDNVAFDAKRLNPLGNIIRKASLDELPELFNVIKGDMSLVGPRPLLPQYLNRYTLEQARRHEVKPGITGWAQVNGRNAISWEDKFKLDIRYVDHRSIWLDIKIVLMTIAKIVSRKGINQPGVATAEEFWGKEKNERKI